MVKGLSFFMKNKYIIGFVVVLVTLNAWSITTIVQGQDNKATVKEGHSKVPERKHATPSVVPTKKLAKQSKEVTPSTPVKNPTPINQKTHKANSSQSTSSNNQETSAANQNTQQSSPSTQNSSVTQAVNPNNPKPTVLVVLHPGSGGASAMVINNNFQYVYVTPTPNLGPFEASFSYDPSNSKGTFSANKPIRECNGVQKHTTTDANGMSITESKGALKGMPRWGCPDGKCAYYCEVYFAPPNTYAYEWPHGAKVTSDQGEEKTFGNW